MSRLFFFLSALLLFAACSDAADPASLTFRGQGEASLDPSVLTGEAPNTDVGPPIVECLTDADCPGGEAACLGAVCGDDSRCVVIDAPDGSVCDDANVCTEGDLCLAGVCQAGDSVCACESDDDCGGEAVDLCQGAWVCSEGQCDVAPGTAVICDTEVGSLCQTSSCVSSTGLCTEAFSPDGELCDDGSSCTQSDSCLAGACVGSDLLGCDDGNSCTADGCDPQSGCTHVPQDAVCDDGSVCTLDDGCSDGVCVGQNPLACSSDNACMEAVCDPGTGCGESPKASGTACDDGNLCTEGDTCDAGACLAGAVVCACEVDADCPDDGDLCNGTPVCVANECVIDAVTVVACDPSTDCQVTICVSATGQCATSLKGPEVSCDDAGPCMAPGLCGQGVCQAEPMLCADGNPCTVDECDLGTDGCVFTPTSVACEDGDPCTLADQCADGACLSGVQDPCLDGDLCTSEDCLEGSGCALTPIPCADGLMCTVDTCVSDTGCVSTPVVCAGGGEPCLDWSCDTLTGACTSEATSGAGCDDGDPCTAGDVCAGASCAGIYDCSDDDPCTLDSCGPNGCEYQPIADGVPCDDGIACSSGDTCYFGTCQGLSLDCVDGDPCTNDACENGACIHEMDPMCVGDDVCGVPKSGGKGCSDGIDSTLADMCIQGFCRGFELDRVKGSGDVGHLLFTHTVRAQGHWFLSQSQYNGAAGDGHNLCVYDNLNAKPAPIKGGESLFPFTDIYDGFAVNSGGSLYQYFGKNWSNKAKLSEALQDSGTATSHAVWVYRQGEEVLVVVAGEEDEEGYLRECTLPDGTCVEPAFNMTNGYWFGTTVGRALTGREKCDDGECEPRVLYAGDSSSANGYTNNMHARDFEDGDWYQSYTDWWPANFETRDVASYGDGRYLAVGRHGYVRYYDGNSWTNTLSNLKGGITDRDFTSVWIGADTVIMVANILTPGGVKVELWASSRQVDADDSNDWSVYSLGTFQGDSAALDVWGAPDGEVRIVGTGGSADGGDITPWLDGLIWSRRPD